MKLCVALDLRSYEECLKVATELKGLDLWLKIGLRAFCRDGADFIKELKNMGFKLFLDLKFYDIPNTMADAASEVAKLGVEMINLHASSGERAIKTVMDRLNSEAQISGQNRPLVLAVTALTSFNDGEFNAVYNENIDSAAIKMAKIAYNAGADGVVCSVYESQKIKDEVATEFITLTPGIRPFGENRGDQKRVADIAAAKAAKADFIVVGRPIYESDNPRAICKKILNLL